MVRYTQYTSGLHTHSMRYAITTCSILREVQSQLSADLSDKMVALEIDSECVDLNNTSTTISIHNDPTRIKKG